MKKAITLVTACMVCLLTFAQAQNQVQKSFYELESDSIANIRISEASISLKLSDKQITRIARLYASQYEEICRNMQMSIMESRMISGSGLSDTDSAAQAEKTRESFDKTCQKFEQRYIKELTEEQAAIWKEPQSFKLDGQFNAIFEHVRANTENFF